ncbi:MAG: ABC transporter ATP-binding protein [Gordonia sp. (in: high G+C Gram-positive bacteria)]
MSDDLPEQGDAIAQRPRITFWQLARSERPAIVWAGVLGGTGALVKVSQALIVWWILQALADWQRTGEGEARIWLLVAVLVSATTAGELLTRQASSVAHHADIRFGRSLRHRQIGHLLRLPLDWFSRNGSGRVKKFVQDDVFRVHELVAHLVPDLAASIITPIAGLALLGWWDPWLCLLALIPLTLSALTLPAVLRGRTERARDYATRLGDLNAASVEAVRGIEPLKVFGAGNRAYPRFRETSQAMAKAYQDWVDATRTGFAFMGAFSSPMFAVAVMGAGFVCLVTRGELDAVLAAPSLIVSASLAAPVSIAVGMIHQFRNANAAAVDLEDFFALPVQRDSGVVSCGGQTGVDVDGVRFQYPDGPVALDGVDAVLAPGTFTALVGPSGSGKSTFAALLPRLVDPDRGSVRLGGADLRDVDRNHLYRQVGFVFQQPYMFRLSIRDNIALTRPDATLDDVHAAARAAQIHDWIVALPHGYDTVIGQDVEPSGGQQQRLSIARAVLTDAPVLVLDEATAYADPDSEADVQRALSELTRGRTLLAIAHRLHTVADADQILVLCDGRILEAGRHDDLLAASGAYARTWASYQGARDRLRGVHA